MLENWSAEKCDPPQYPKKNQQVGIPLVKPQEEGQDEAIWFKKSALPEFFLSCQPMGTPLASRPDEKSATTMFSDAQLDVAENKKMKSSVFLVRADSGIPRPPYEQRTPTFVLTRQGSQFLSKFRIRSKSEWNVGPKPTNSSLTIYISAVNLTANFQFEK
jgi:hypothetical protein